MGIMRILIIPLYLNLFNIPHYIYLQFAIWYDYKLSRDTFLISYIHDMLIFTIDIFIVAFSLVIYDL